jgi:leader peptidase (prepilin peptidase) / N-methyltransferase
VNLFVNLVVAEYSAILLLVFVLGAIVGSMTNVCIYRLPREERFWIALRSIVYPPSHCPRCDRLIPFYDNIPVLGWLLLRGRCRNCRGKISFRYPCIELLTAVLFTLLYAAVVPNWFAGKNLSEGCLHHLYGPQSLGAQAALPVLLLVHLRYALLITLVVALIVATFIDFDLRIIPDSVTLPVMALGLIGHTLGGYLFIVPVWYQTPAIAGRDSAAGLFRALFEPMLPEGFLPASMSLQNAGIPEWIAASPHLHGFFVSLAGIIVGGGTIWGVRLIGQWALKREAMGFGDVTLMAMIGSIVGWQATLAIFFIAPICALCVAGVAWLIRRDREIPYGPYLSLATLLVLLFWQTLWPPIEGSILALGPLLPLIALVMFALLGVLLWMVRMIKTLLGWNDEELEPEEEWGAGDQLFYIAGETVDHRAGQWPRADWPGCAAGRGLGQESTWKGK